MTRVGLPTLQLPDYHGVSCGAPIDALKDEGIRYLRAAEIQAVWSALEPLSGEKLWANFDLKAFEQGDPWPPGWTDSDDDRDFFFRHFAGVKSFYERAASAGDAIILQIN